MSGSEKKRKGLSQDKDNKYWEGIKDQDGGETFENISTLFKKIAEKFPSRERNYKNFCNQLGVKKKEAEEILEECRNVFRKAVKEVLERWVEKGKATKDGLDSALQKAEAGSLCAVVAKHLNGVRSKKPSKRKAGDSGAESPTKKKCTGPLKSVPARRQPVQQKKKDQGKKESKSKTRAVPEKKNSSGKANSSVISKTGLKETQPSTSAETGELEPDVDGFYTSFKVAPAEYDPAKHPPESTYETWKSAKKGLVYILNNNKFPECPNLKERVGSNVDKKNMEHVFSELGYKPKIYVDLSKEEILKSIDQIVADINAEPNRHTSLCLVLMSHGNEEGIVCTDSCIVTIEEIKKKLSGRNCKGLCGKPKLLFTQACRGKEISRNTSELDLESSEQGTSSEVEIDHVSLNFTEPTVDVDGEGDHGLPENSDIFVAMATSSGCYSIRNNTEGSWFIQAISEIFLRHASVDDIHELMRKVTNRVTDGFRTRTENLGLRMPSMEVRQTPAYESQGMRKRFYFFPKYPGTGSTSKAAVTSKEPSKHEAEDSGVESPTKKKRTGLPKTLKAVPLKNGSSGKGMSSVISKTGMGSTATCEYPLEVIEKLRKLKQVYRMAVLIQNDEKVRYLYISEGGGMKNLIQTALKLKKGQQVVFTNLKKTDSVNTTPETKVVRDAEFQSNKAAKKAYTCPPVVELQKVKEAADKKRMSLKGTVKKIQHDDNKSKIILSDGQVEEMVFIWKRDSKSNVKKDDKVKITALEKSNGFIHSTPSTCITKVK